VARLTASGYLNDAEYARSYVRIRATQRALGPGRLAQELRVKGVAEAEIAAALAALAAEEGPAASAARAAARKMRALAALPPEVARRRLAAHLARQGFSAEIVLQTCRTVVPQGGDDWMDRPLDSLKP
jgi:regulatory protein